MHKLDTTQTVRILTQNLDKLGPLFIVAKVGSVSRAAKVVGLSQSALSHLLTKFERDLGFRCFERRARGLELTEEGRMLTEYSKKLFADLGEMVERMAAGEKSNHRPLKVGTHETLAAHIWPYLIRELEKSADLPTISIKSGRIDALVDQVLEREVDLLFSVEPSPHSRLKILPIYEGSLECFVGPEWVPPGSGKRKRSPSTLKLAELKDVPVFTDLEAHTRQGMPIPRALALAGMLDLGRCEVASFEAALNLAAMNLGIAVVPDRNAGRALKDKRLRRLTVTDWKDPSPLRYRICVSFPENSTRAQACGLISARTRELLAKAGIQ